MEMIDVLKKLQEIAETKPELVKDAVDNVERTNPKVDESRMKDYLHDEAEKLSRDEFIKKHGKSMAGFYDAINGDPDDVPHDVDTMMNLEGKEELKKETVKESIQISADTPEEAGMMMQILKLAGVKPVDAKMIGAQDDEPEHDNDDATGSMDMARMRDIIKKPEDEKQEETFANEPEEKVADVDTLVNVHSGGANRQKVQYKKEYPGDNPMAVAKEDQITEQDLANSLREQYDNFKKAYQEAAKPDFLDMDKDGNKKEPMKKAIKDKEAKDKK
jgi:hypothetical protein